jgi:hypothetical protein
MQRFIAFGLVFSSFFLVVTGLPRLIAQDNPCLTRTIPVTPIDARGTPLQDLQASSLLGKVHGRPVAILSATLNTQPRRIMICVDTSGSMMAPGLWSVIRMMLEDIARVGPTVGQLGMELFAEDVFDVVNISPNPNAVRMKTASVLAAEVEDLVPKRARKTALVDALWQAGDHFTPPRPGDVIYVLTDGHDNRSHHTGKQLEDRLLSRATRVFAFLTALPFTPYGRVLAEEEFGPEALNGIATMTGGHLIYLCPNPRDLGCEKWPNYFADWTKGEQRSAPLGAAHLLYQQMAVYYDVTIRLPFALEKRADLDLGIVDDWGHKRKDIELLYPHRLPPCERTSPMAPTAPN